VHAEEAAIHEAEHSMELLLAGVSVGVAVLGFFLAWLLYYRRRDLPAKVAAWFGGLYDAVLNKYYVDELYGAVFVKPIIEGSAKLLWRGIDVGAIDGTINASAEAAQDVSREVGQMQSGNIRSYAGWVAAGAAVVLAYMIWAGTR
jgi:NADH-quinone oxidoreductase subunit L